MEYKWIKSTLSQIFPSHRILSLGNICPCGKNRRVIWEYGSNKDLWTRRVHRSYRYSPALLVQSPRPACGAVLTYKFDLTLTLPMPAGRLVCHESSEAFMAYSLVKIKFGGQAPKTAFGF